MFGKQDGLIVAIILLQEFFILSFSGIFDVSDIQGYFSSYPEEEAQLQQYLGSSYLHTEYARYLEIFTVQELRRILDLSPEDRDGYLTDLTT